MVNEGQIAEQDFEGYFEEKGQRKKQSNSIPEEGFVLVTLPDLSTLKIQINETALLKEIYGYKVYELHHIIGKDDVVIDAGAHVGVFSIKAALQGAKVFAFEPEPSNFEILKNNVERNQLPNIVCHNCALGHISGTFKFWIHPFLSGSHSLGFKQEKWIPVRVETLDTILKEEAVSQIDLFKIDVEGSELEVLQGSQETLEITENLAIAAYHFKNEPERLKQYLDPFGFQIEVEDSGPFRDSHFLYGKKSETIGERRPRTN